MNKYIISFDKSNEDIPTLIVAHGSSLFNPTINVVKIITGDKAVRIFEELTKKEESDEEDIRKTCKTCKYDEYSINTEPCFSCRRDYLDKWEPKKEESKEDVIKENVSVKSCSTCNYFEYNIDTEPCFSCWCGGKHEAWEPREVEE